MKIKYDAQKGTRINYRFIGFTTFEEGWSFSYDTNRWERNTHLGNLKKGCCSHQDCRSVKAFRRKLKKAPKGVKFTLVSRWVGHSVEGIGSFENTKER